ncbi:hypothetical protein [Jeongeupia chitinilytica]|uniref:DUF342 domain-containing protein n=1 Tax=Jeongeupia chitinilytica TaxID=1041641 RepID=A0ABQ3H3B9_9NEIS|nr:hypothetical protein [Jeongeupia chitinilytica]GHD67501.1 hypothetical protein GCM10007350_31280 [Jeongeupia chitinilytica]
MTSMLRTRPASQRGIATILILLLTGLSLTAAVLGTVYYVRGTQEQGVSAHAMTQAQVKAWTGVEVVKTYLTNLDAAGIKTLAAATTSTPIALTLSGVDGVSAKVVSSDSATNPTRLTVQVTGSTATGTRAASTSTVQVVYAVVPGTTGGPANNPNTVNIKGDTTTGGAISATGSNAIFNVDGNFTSNGSMTGFKVIFATGNLNLNAAGNSAETVSAQGNVNITNSGSYNKVLAMGDIVASGKISVSVLMQSNKSVTISNSSDIQRIDAIGNVTLSSQANVVTVRSQGSVDGRGGNIGDLLAEGGYQGSWSGSATGSVGGTVSNGGNTTLKVTQQAGLKVPVAPLTLDSLQANKVDANELRDSANYIFEPDASNAMTVTVKSVSGITDGKYYLYQGKINNQPFYDWLCTVAQPSKAADCVVKIGRGNSDYNSLVSYNATQKKWTLTTSVSGAALPPGIAWFKGDVSFAGGTYINTMIATGNMSTGGNLFVYGVNAASFSDVCNNGNFPGLKPANFCAAGASKLTSVPLGNIGLLAGSYEAGYSDAAHFSGGTIALGAGNEIHGNIVAGDVLQTSGSTTIYGYVTTAHQSNDASHQNKFSASTTIRLDGLPDSFNPGLTPPGAGGSTGTGGSTSTQARVLWSRYL